MRTDQSFRLGGINPLQAMRNQQAQRQQVQQRIDADEQRRLAFDQLSGTADRMMSDPDMARSMSAYRDAMTDGPYSDSVQSALRSQSSDRSAAAEAAQNAMLARQQAAAGGSIYDASYQGAQRGNLAQRQLENQASARDIALQATLGNFEAKQRAAQNLAATRMDQYRAGIPLRQQAAGYHIQSYDEPQTGANYGSMSAPTQRAPRMSLRDRWAAMDAGGGDAPARSGLVSGRIGYNATDPVAPTAQYPVRNYVQPNAPRPDEQLYTGGDGVTRSSNMIMGSNVLRPSSSTWGF